ncbi:trypsin-like serine peptidase [Thioalkalicoccus limnaeus]
MLLRVAAPGQAFGPPSSGAEIEASVRRNRDAGSEDEAARLFWLPLVLGDTLVLQLELPAGVEPEDARFELVHVSHFFRLPFLERSANRPAAWDKSTNPACAEQWDAPSRATTLLLYTHPDGSTGACTGTLLNDTDPQTFIPYVLTAHHCFPDQVVAASIESLWFVRSETCGGDLASYATVSCGADVLYHAKSTDTALLRLRHPPPAGAVFIGWQPTLPAKGTEVFGVHHPAAGRQQRTRAVVSEYMNCEEVDYCGDDYDPDAVHFVCVDRGDGGTAPGSSGSGLYNSAQRLIGTHLGGSDADGFDYYGRFDQPYRDGLVRWLGVGGLGD